tara:strand:+ start:8673 stop:8945 length:273 start_codon:yes stop_codon:yes gene_type:complete
MSTKKKTKVAKSRAELFETIVAQLEKYSNHQRELIAKQAGIHPMTIYWWVTGVTTSPRLSTIIPVAEVLGFDIVLKRNKTKGYRKGLHLV